MRNFLLSGLLTCALANGVLAADPPSLPDLFVEAFGERVRLDPEKVRAALAAPAGGPLGFDEDGTPGIDTFYFVDRNPRHTEEFGPIVVKAIAPEGNFPNNQFNWSNALFVADWRGDGGANRIVGHFDDDGDGDIDRMLVASPWHDYFGPLHLVLAEDIGDDNRLWYHRNYWTDTQTYWWRSDFNGDEVFHFFTYDRWTKKWDQRGEGPFAFYDHDGDGYADEVVRRDTTMGDNLTSVRWSFDLDQDANEFQVHDYDLSISGYGRVDIAADLVDTTCIGLAPTGPFLPWRNARAWVAQAPWKALMLTADEIDNNVDLQEHGPLHERWEGVLNHASESFPQVGGPSAGPFNRRAEVDHDNSGHGKLYYSTVDRRFHLFGAESGFQNIDFNLDGKLDMTIRTGDRSGDGYLDAWEVDVDADGVIDLAYGYLQRQGNDMRVPYQPWDREAHELASIAIETRQQAIEESVKLIEVMRAVLQTEEKAFQVDAAETFYRDSLAGWRSEDGAGLKMRASIETERYYADIICHRYFARILKLKLPGQAHLSRLYWGGSYRNLANELLQLFPKAQQPAPTAPAATLKVANTSERKLWRQPVSVDLHKVFPDRKIPVDGVSVYDPRRHLHPLPLPAQADDLDGDGAADELVFQTDLRAGEVLGFPVRLTPTPASEPLATAALAGTVATLSTPTAVFTLTDGSLCFTAIDIHTEAKQPSRSASVELVAIEKCPPLEVLRNGPLRAVMRSKDGALVVMANSRANLLELRASKPLAIKQASLPGAVASSRALGTLACRAEYSTDLASAIILPQGASANQAKAQVFTITENIWVHAWWRAADQAPIMPGSSNWTDNLERLAARITAVRVSN